MDANIFVKEHISIIEDILIAPDIPEKKLNNAIKAFGCEDSMSSIIALYDNTIFGSAKEGMIFTGEKMLIKTSNALISIKYEEISKAEYFEALEQVKEGKTKAIKGIKIFKGGEVVELKDYDIGPTIYKPLEVFLSKLIVECSEFKEVNLLQPLEEMPSMLKNAYVKILINMTFDNDGEIDEKELAEIMFLMGRINIDDDGRFELMSYISEISDSAISTQDLLTIIKDNAEAAHYEAIMISLVKDIFSIHASTTTNTEEGCAIQVGYPDFLEKHKDLFGLSADKIELARTAVENDFKILYENLDDDKIKQAVKELAAKAASVGAPIGAIYFSGFTGLSAAGITSGLASLGMGGMLGLSSMATGIGVAVLIGVGVYEGVKYLTSNNELSRYKTRELMLHEVIKQTQKSISLMIGDINIIVKKLNDAISHHNTNRATIEKLSKLLLKAQGAIKQMNSKSNQCVNMEAALQCPQILDISRIKSIANEPTKKEIYAFIVSCYEEKEQNGTQQFVRKRNLSTDTLEKLGEILQSVGYFSAANNAKSAIGGLFSKNK